jgi:hypothetical protein
MAPFAAVVLALAALSAAGLQRVRSAQPAHCGVRCGQPNMRWETVRPGVLARLGTAGAVLGPAVDAVHNQALLAYDVLPVALQLPLGFAKTSLLIPPLLAVAYALLGGVLPAITSASLQAPPPPPGGLAPAARAGLAVTSTVCIIKLSEVLTTSTALPPPASLLLLAVACIAQWRLLDATLPSLLLATVAAVGGPIAELPLMQLGCWHYLSPDYWPLAPFGFGPGVPGAPEAPGSAWAGLSLITGPCYFAVTTDAIALGRWFASGYSGEAPADSDSARRRGTGGKTGRAAARMAGRRASGTTPPTMRACNDVSRARRTKMQLGGEEEEGRGRARRPEMHFSEEEEREARVAVHPSLIGGLGAFAAEPICAGSFVCAYQGERLSPREAGRRYYGVDAEYLFRLAGSDLVDASRTDHFSRRINHAHHGTLRAVVDQDRIRFYAARDVRAGEELNFDYGEEFWVAARHAPAPGTDERSLTLRRLLSPYTLRRVMRTAGPLWGSLLLPLLLPAMASSLAL